MGFTRSQPRTMGNPDGIPVVVRNVTDTIAIEAKYELNVDATSLNLGPGNGYVLEIGYQQGGGLAASDFVSIKSVDGAWSNAGTFGSLKLTMALSSDDAAIGHPLAIRWTNKAQNVGSGPNNAYLDNLVLFYTLPEGLAGDYNDDGTVNIADYTVWRDHLGARAGTLPNDIDGGPIGEAQYLTWKAQFRVQPASFSATGNAQPVAIRTTVPEPDSKWILIGWIAILPLGRAFWRFRQPAPTV